MLEMEEPGGGKTLRDMPAQEVLPKSRKPAPTKHAAPLGAPAPTSANGTGAEQQTRSIDSGLDSNAEEGVVLSEDVEHGEVDNAEIVGSDDRAVVYAAEGSHRSVHFEQGDSDDAAVHSQHNMGISDALQGVENQEHSDSNPNRLIVDSLSAETSIFPSNEEDFPALGGEGETPVVASASKSAAGAKLAMSWASTAAANADQAFQPSRRKSETSSIPAAPDASKLADDVSGMSITRDDVDATRGGVGSSHRPVEGVSRILTMGGTAYDGSIGELDDDIGAGEWIQPETIEHLKAEGLESTFRMRPASQASAPEEFQLTKRQQKRRRHKANAIHRCRTGCSSTDFTVQNVLLQMGITLVSGGGQVVRKARKWVLRCAACFRTCAPDPSRLFCPVCGNSTLERIACSVDAATGEVKLHMRPDKPYGGKWGSKHPLPAPGNAGGRFSGGLLLREDQLLSGIWAQKSKMAARNVRSAFGEHITESVGIQVDRAPGIVVGMGTRNPNAAKGRERRGKKKKNPGK
jgi:hypothetical protein